MPTRVAGSSRSSSTLLRREPFRTRLPVRSIGHAITGGPSLGISLGCSGTVLSLWIETSKSPSLGRSFSGCANAGLAIARAATSRLTSDTTLRKLRLVSPFLHAAIGSILRLLEIFFKLSLGILARNLTEHYTQRWPIRKRGRRNGGGCALCA